MQKDEPIRKDPQTDITIYGATSFVAKHVITYLVQASIHLDEPLKVTLAGRNASKLQALHQEWTKKMQLLCTATNEGATPGKCVFDVYDKAAADDIDGLRRMVARTSVVLATAGPFAQYSSHVVGACAEYGTDYVDITGEMAWVAQMRQAHGHKAAASGARIVSLCGFDSIPSDLAIFGAVQALKKQCPNTDIEKAISWHACYGMANGGTLKTIQDYPIDWKGFLRTPVPFFVEDPLLLTHPTKVRNNPEYEGRKNKLALAEWFNQLFMFHIFLKGFSAPFGMAAVNAKVVHASAVALGYGPKFTYQERFLPVGFGGTTQLKILSIIPALVTHFSILLGVLLLRLPMIGNIVLNIMGRPGTGAPDSMCAGGHAEVYAQVQGPVNPRTGKVDRANCFLKFKGDPGNWVTAQTVSEAALTLLLSDEKDMPPNSADGFGTPAELLGNPLLERLCNSPVRKVEFSTSVRKQTTQIEWEMFD